MSRPCRRCLLLTVLLTVIPACGEDPGPAPQEEPEVEELGIGEVDDLKADGGWGAALTCKPIPALPVLAQPEIVVSLDGLTLRLVDKATGFEKVFPIGPGKIENGKSLTPTSLLKPGMNFFLRLDTPVGQESTSPSYAPWAYSYSCKFWWPDPATGKKIPVFAGLPFMRLEGAPTLGYAIHGPIDSYTLPSGGRLTRGYVSHGCIRMESEDVLELYSRCLGRKVPVRIQQSVERRADGTAVDTPSKWFLAECTSDADCAFTGGVCRSNFYGGHGLCTRACTSTCPDLQGQPVSFCVEDPEDDGKGICTLKGTSLNNWCQRYPGLSLVKGEPRLGQPTVKADVCLPGSDGWIGAACFSDLDCAPAGMTCHLADSSEDRPGFCTLPCSKYCPDLAGQPGTFCVEGDPGGECVQKCILPDDCPFGYECEPGVPRFNQPSVTASVCL
ncbi:MAG: L,D-transpeptidase [Deltaproteobacteria bacterium]|nr:L,D-transpeptidase [Deltaproteobacteria bacterium]